MTVAGWLFMASAWAIVGGLFVYTFGRLLRDDRERR
jgi:hypothetical protein